MSEAAVAHHVEQHEQPEVTLSRAARLWLSLFEAKDSSTRLAEIVLGLHTVKDGPAREAMYHCALDLGLTPAEVVIEQAAAPKPAPTADIEIEDPAIAEIPRWRLAAPGEDAIAALALPVELMQSCRTAWSMSLDRMGDAHFLGSIGDVIALPLDGSRPLSFFGITAAVGRFAVVERGEVHVLASVKSWLADHFEEAGRLAGEMEPEQVSGVIAAPDSRVTLMIAPDALEWRPSRLSFCVPASAKTVIVPDSRALAAHIAALMSKKEVRRRPPRVFGPRTRRKREEVQ